MAAVVETADRFILGLCLSDARKRKLRFDYLPVLIVVVVDVAVLLHASGQKIWQGQNIRMIKLNRHTLKLIMGLTLNAMITCSCNENSFTPHFYMSRVMRYSETCLCENKGADQLCGHN